MSRVAIVSSKEQGENVASFVDEIIVLPRSAPIDYPSLLSRTLRKLGQALHLRTNEGQDSFIFLGPESLVPSKEHVELAFRQLERGYQLIAPFRDHRSKVMYYTFMLFGSIDEEVVAIVDGWVQGLSKWYPWDAFSKALYAMPVRFWPVPSTWWKQVTGGGVGVVIPCYRHEELLGESVESALGAGASQVIVVDDGSTGDVVGALAVFAQKPVYVVRQENKGLPAARNVGISAASCEHIISLDADDKLGVGFVDAAFLVESAFRWVYSNVTLFGDKNKTININVDERTMRTMQPAHPAILFPKEAWRFVGGYDETIGGFESWDFHARMMQAGWVPVKCAGMVYYRKQTGEGMLTRVLSDKQHHLDALARRSPVFFGDAFARKELG